MARLPGLPDRSSSFGVIWINHHALCVLLDRVAAVCCSTTCCCSCGEHDPVHHLGAGRVPCATVRRTTCGSPYCLAALERRHGVPSCVNRSDMLYKPLVKGPIDLAARRRAVLRFGAGASSTRRHHRRAFSPRSCTAHGSYTSSTRRTVADHRGRPQGERGRRQRGRGRALIELPPRRSLRRSGDRGDDDNDSPYGTCPCPGDRRVERTWSPAPGCRTSLTFAVTWSNSDPRSPHRRTLDRLGPRT